MDFKENELVWFYFKQQWQLCLTVEHSKVGEVRIHHASGDSSTERTDTLIPYWAREADMVCRIGQPNQTYEVVQGVFKIATREMSLTVARMESTGRTYKIEVSAEDFNNYWQLL